MGKQFDITELVRVAVADEEGGIALYTSLAETAHNTGLKDMFQSLSAMEKVHRDRFRKLVDGLGDQETDGVYPDEYVDYLEALSTGGGGSNAAAQVEACEGDPDLIDLAMRFEREQLQLQQDIGDVLGDRHGDIINEVIAEERSHLVQLSRAKQEIFGG